MGRPIHSRFTVVFLTLLASLSIALLLISPVALVLTALGVTIGLVTQ